MLDRQDQELFNRFRYRTLYTLNGSAMVAIYEDHMLEVSFTVSLRSSEMLSVLKIHSRQLLTFTDTCSIVSIPDAWYPSGDSCP